jgi:ABC-2 type transport system permease protein
MMLSVFAVYFRDTLHLYGVLTTAWMYLTPIFYPVTAVPESVQKVLWWNPLYHIITAFRDIVLYGKCPNLSNTIICLSWCGISLLVGLVLFKRKQANFILYI